MRRVLRRKLRHLLLVAAILVVFCLLPVHWLSDSSPSDDTGHDTAGTSHVSADSLNAMDQQVPNLPIGYWRQQGNVTRHKRHCAPMPSMYDVHYSNVYWQTVHLPGARGVEGQLLGAYYDARTVDAPTPVVRLVAMADTRNLTYEARRLYCQLWLDGQASPVVVRVTEYTLIWYNKWPVGRVRDYHPYLIKCTLPASLTKIPAAVSLVNNRCDKATNILKVVYEPPTMKQDFAVCVKGLDFPQTDLSLRLIEWIELLRLLGADKINFYRLQVHPNMTRVLEFYQRQGLVEVIPISLPGNQPNHPVLQHLYLNDQKDKIRKRFNEVISYNDCFYRNFRLFKYVVVLDIDELIIPVGDIRTWSEMIEAVKADKATANKTYSSFVARHVYFFDGNLEQWVAESVPGHLFMARHVYRAANFSQPMMFVKSFFDTEKVITLHNHLALTCKGGSYWFCWHRIPTSIGRLHHYRKDCQTSFKNCGVYKNSSLLDTTIWRYTDELAPRTLSVMKVLGLAGST